MCVKAKYTKETVAGSYAKITTIQSVRIVQLHLLSVDLKVSARYNKTSFKWDAFFLPLINEKKLPLWSGVHNPHDDVSD